MVSRNFRDQKKENAQGLVEFALILPILLLVLIGIMEIGRLMFYYVSITTASREGARYGSAVGYVNGVPRYLDCDGIRDAALKAGNFAGLHDDDIRIFYDVGGDEDNPPECPTPSYIQLIDRVVVTASGGYKPFVPLLDQFFPEDGLDITSTTARSIIKDVRIEGTPSSDPTTEPPSGENP